MVAMIFLGCVFAGAVLYNTVVAPMLGLNKIID